MVNIILQVAGWQNRMQTAIESMGRYWPVEPGLFWPCVGRDRVQRSGEWVAVARTAFEAIIELKTGTTFLCIETSMK